eukprot:2311970-Amphidinium_carterae.1
MPPNYLYSFKVNLALRIVPLCRGSLSASTFNALEHTEEELLECVPVMLMQSKSSQSFNLQTEKVQAQPTASQGALPQTSQTENQKW